jgi:hypothetical protein
MWEAAARPLAACLLLRMACLLLSRRCAIFELQQPHELGARYMQAYAAQNSLQNASHLPLCLLCCCQGDAVGAWSGDNLAGVLFPTADTIKQLRQLAERSPKAPELLLIFNPQWELQVGCTAAAAAAAAAAAL